MNFDRKYELDDVVLDGHIKTFRATEIATRRPVFVHLFERGDGASREALLRKVRSLQADRPFAKTARRLDLGSFNGVAYAVTDVIGSFTSFEDWLEEQWERSRSEAKERWKEDLLRTLVSGDYQGAFEAAGNALAAFPEDHQLHNVERVAHLLWQARENAPPEMRHASFEVLGAIGEEPEEASHRIEWLRQQIAELQAQPIAETIASDEEDAIENEREKFALWCYATARRLEIEGNLAGARAVAGQGLACYRREIEVPKEAMEGVVDPRYLPELESAWAFYLGPLRDIGRRVMNAAAGLGEMLRPEPAPAHGPLQGPLMPLAAGLAAAGMMITIGWLAWSVRTDGGGQTPPAVAQNRVQIESFPSGAAILINGEECGVSNCDLELPPGLYQTEARLAGYRSSSDFFQVFERGGTNIRLALRPLSPVIRVFSDLANGSVALDGRPAGEMTDGVWEHELASLAPGEHTLTISDRGSEASIRFEARPGSAPVILGPVETHNLQAAVVAGLGSEARIYSNAEITEAFLQDGTRGDVGYQEASFTGLSEGSHELTLAAGQDRQSVFFDAGPQPALTAFIQTDRNYGALRIRTGMDGANVYLNGKKYRRATRNGELVVYLYPEQYSVWVEKDGFRSPAAKTVAIRAGERSRLDFSLSPLQTSPFLAGSAAFGSEVPLNGSAPATMGLEGGVTLHAPPGARNAVLSRQSRQALPQYRTIANRGGSEAEDVGRLHLAVDPPEADAHIIIRHEGETVDRVVTDRVLTLAEGVYMVRATAPGYQPAVAKVRLTANQSSVAMLELEPQPKPTFQLADWEGIDGWTREGSQLVRRGGDFALSPVDPQPGTYEFGAFLQKGSRLEWTVNYVNEKNYTLYQLGKDFFSRIQVVDGRKSAPHKVSHTLRPEGLIRVRVEVSQDSIVHKFFQHGEWAVMDRWNHTGARFARGSFGFYVPNKSQIGLRDFSFVPGS